MSAQQYEISLWRDLLTNTGITEGRVAIIGGNDLTYLGRAVNPKLTEKVNGEKTFSFTLYNQFYDDLSNEIIDNPYIPLLKNESHIKLKLIKNDVTEWYDFVITNIAEDSAAKSYNYTCADRWVKELAKNGYSIVLSSELNNNCATAPELITTVLEGSGWSFDSDNSDVLYSFNTTHLIQMAIDGTNSKTVTDILTNTSITLSTTSIFFVSYNDYIEKWNNDTKKFTADTQLIIVNGSNIKVDENYCILNTYNAIYNADTAGLKLQDNSPVIYAYTGKYLSERSNSVYDSVNDAIVQQYTKTGDSENIYYGQTVDKYQSGNSVLDLMANGTKIKTTTGWTSEKTIGIEALYGRSKFLSQLCIPSRATVDNSGLYNHNSELRERGGIAKGEKFVVDIVTTSLIQSNVQNNLGFSVLKEVSDNSTTNIFNINTSVGYPVYTPSSISSTLPLYITTVIDGQQEDVGCYRYVMIGEFTQSVSPEELSENTRALKIQLGTQGYGLDIASIQFYPYVPFDKTKNITYTENSVIYLNISTPNHYNPLDVETHTTYYLSGEDINNTNLFVDDSLFTPYNYTGLTKYHKVRAVEASQSNRFNILSSISEAFECWIRLNVAHADNGAITSKKVAIKNVSGAEVNTGFKYGVNLSSIKRDLQSDEIVTKLIVAPNSNSLAPNGSCNVAESSYNDLADNVLYNFEYYRQIGVLGSVFDSDYTEFSKNLSTVNKSLLQYNTEKINLSNSLTKLKARQKILKLQIDAAHDQQNEILNYLKTVYKQEYGNLDYFYFPDLLIDYNYYQQNGQLITYIVSFVNHYDEFMGNFDKVIVKIKQSDNGNFQKTKFYTLKCVDRINEIYEHQAQVIAGTSEYTFNISAIDHQYELIDIYFDESGTNEYIYSKYACIIYNEAAANQLASYIDITNELSTNNAEYSNVSELIDDLEAQLTGINNNITTSTITKNGYNTAFLNKYNSYIREGTWNSEDYYNHDSYYLDACDVSAKNAKPNVKYSISVIDVSQLDGYEDFSFNCGDITFIEDTEFFGYQEDGITPYHEQVIISEYTHSLDNPTQDQITVQNYRSQFDELFNRISASVQSLQYTQGGYNRASKAIQNNGTVDEDILQESLNESTPTVTGQAGYVTLDDEDGITLTDPTNSDKKIRISGAGISQSNGDSWQQIIGNDGVNGAAIQAGNINISKSLNIGPKDNPNFQWNENGIHAFSKNSNNKKWVRFDEYGIYSVNDKPSTWKTANREEIQNNSVFSLTDIGLSINLKENLYTKKIDKAGIITDCDREMKISANAKIGKTENRIYNAWDINDATHPYYGGDNTNYFAKVIDIGNDNKKFAVYSDGRAITNELAIKDSAFLKTSGRFYVLDGTDNMEWRPFITGSYGSITLRFGNPSGHTVPYTISATSIASCARTVKFYYKTSSNGEAYSSTITLPTGKKSYTDTFKIGTTTSYFAVSQDGTNYDADTRRLIFDMGGTYGAGYLVNTWKANNPIIVSSWRGYKKNITDLPAQYDTLFDNLHPRIYQYNYGSSNRNHCGFILDEMGSALAQAQVDPSTFAPYCVDDVNNPDSPGGIRYEELVALNTWQIQLLKARVAQLEQQNQVLEAKFNELERRLSSLEVTNEN